jgi:hypothetical protein
MTAPLGPITAQRFPQTNKFVEQKTVRNAVNLTPPVFEMNADLEIGKSSTNAILMPFIPFPKTVTHTANYFGTSRG